MSAKKYKFNTDSLKYEEIRFSFFAKLRNISPFLLSVFLFSSLFLYLLDQKLESPKIRMLLSDKKELEMKLNLLEAEAKRAGDILSELQYHDDVIYRTYFEILPLSPSLRSAGYGGNTYNNLFNESEYSGKLKSLNKELDKISKKLVVQSRSYDEVLELARTKEKRLAARPAIQPVSINDLIRFGSAFGVRFHPILKLKKMHEGIDLTAPRGTKIYATAKGKVLQAGKTSGGYGNKILVDHDFGYRTLYGHCAEIFVNPGQVVERGEVIGTVGSTGLSVSPHLHYEVHVNGRAVNPIYYYATDLSSEEFDHMIELLSNADPAFDIN